MSNQATSSIEFRTNNEIVEAYVTSDAGWHRLEVEAEGIGQLGISEFQGTVEAALQGEPTAAAPGRLAAPVVGRVEVWAAGVTYQDSRRGRMAENPAAADSYDRVYSADRPELFFKANSWRVTPHGGPLGSPHGSTATVPEAELALFLNHEGQVMGFGICNDLTSRSIEGENPLYLPQAKMFRGGCALGPALVPAWQVEDPTSLAIEVTVGRGHATAWNGHCSTSQLNRSLEDLVKWLFRDRDFPHGVWLSTGTGVVPGLDFALTDGDVVRISIEGLGELANPMRISTEERA